MPRSTFNAGMFRSAAPGMTKLAAALGGGDQAYQQTYNGTLGLKSKMAQALAAAREHDAKASVEETKNTILSGRPQQFQRVLAANAGVDVPTVAGFMQRLDTGQAPQVPMGPPTDEGKMGVGSMQFPPEVQSKLAQQLARFTPMLTDSGDLDMDKWAKAQGEYRGMDLGDQVLNGTRKAGDVGRAQAAMGGKPIYHTDSSGSVLDLFSGGLNTDNPMATSSIGLRNSQAKQATAGAAENYAQAGAANATADLRKRQAGAVGATGGGRIPVGYRYVADEATGSVKLEPIPGGPKDPNAQTGKALPGTVSKALLENQQNLRRAETALALIQGKQVGGATGDKAATGWKGFVPNGVLNRMDPKGVSTRAAIADLGSLVIHDRSGAAVTASEFPRLAPFIPQATDDATTVETKLKNFVKNYSDIVGESVDFYRASGFNVPAEHLRGATVTEQPPAAGGGFKYLGTEGG